MSLIRKMSPAILGSRKMRVSMQDGHKVIVNPHIVVRRKEGNEILKTMLDNGDCLDIPLQQIKGVAVLQEVFAIDSTCLNFDYDEYELVFPRKEDWFQFGAVSRNF